MHEWKTYGGRLAWAMNRAGKTNQSELARAIGVKPQSIQYLCGPGSNAQGSIHTPALAKVLGVSPDWLARGEGTAAPLTYQGGFVADSASAVYQVGGSQGAPVTGTYKVTGQGELEMTGASPDELGGEVHLPTLRPPMHAMRIKGNGLAPYAKDGQYLLLQPAGPELAFEENILITLASGQMLIRELMQQRADGLVVLPVHGGQTEVIDSADIVRVDSVLCVLPRRWGPVEEGPRSKP
ncbi:MAG: XRE family transcriptional regulator [Rubrivivax sp.]|nr:MAG: XRE family transcriptional regulator [Rubrivivax sp.]